MTRSRLRRFRRTAGNFILPMFLLVRAFSVCRADSTNGASLPAQEVSIPFFSATNGIGSWMWASNVFDDQTCQFWKTFEVPSSSSVTNARLVMTADDEFTVYLDGRELGHGVDWRELFSFDITPILTTGKHVIAIRAYNSFFSAGVILKLEVHLTDGGVVLVKSDPTWRVVPNSVKHWETRTTAADDWPAATIKAAMGEYPWSQWPVNVVGMPTLQPVHLAFWQTVWFQITVLSLFGLLILFSLQLMAQLALHRNERLLLQQERTRIAREIHDDIGSKMTQLVLHWEVAQRNLPDGSTTQLQLAEICDESRSVLAAMDEILWAVNPQRDTLRDFASYVCKYAEEFLKLTNIQCLFEVSPEMPAVAFNLALRRSLLMAIKETLNNAVKYSEATELRLRIQWENEVLQVVVHDNGKGFNPAIVNPERNGLTNMRQRMSELGGSCQIFSEPGKGCRIEFRIPLKRPQRKLWNKLLRTKTSSIKSNSHPLNQSSPKP